MPGLVQKKRKFLNKLNIIKSSGGHTWWCLGDYVVLILEHRPPACKAFALGHLSCECYIYYKQCLGVLNVYLRTKTEKKYRTQKQNKIQNKRFLKISDF